MIQPQIVPKQLINQILKAKESSGFPLPAALRQKMEWVFQANFSAVRLHLSNAPRMLNTIAFATGNHIFLLPEIYQPTSRTGQEIIGHELAHVLQQRRGWKLDNSKKKADVMFDYFEKEAIKAGINAALGNRVKLGSGNLKPNKNTIKQQVVQTYTVIHSSEFAASNIKIENDAAHHEEMLTRIQPDYSRDAFIVQKKVINNFKTFLRTDNRVNYKSYASTDINLELRVSENGNIAIQHVNLGDRQAKVFYATDKILGQSNKKLNKINSDFRLIISDKKSKIKIGKETLFKIFPNYVGLPTKSYGLETVCENDCGRIIEKVLGKTSSTFSLFVNSSFAPSSKDSFFEYHTAKLILNSISSANRLDEVNNANGADYARTVTEIAKAYGRLLFQDSNNANFSLLKVNQFVDPSVGEGFLTTSLNAITERPDGGGFVHIMPLPGDIAATMEDYSVAGLEGKPPQIVKKNLVWQNHWGGVVVKDGNDVITLENYARITEDGGINENDKRYYFQMYNTNDVGHNYQQSWHKQWTKVEMIPYGTGLPGHDDVSDWGVFTKPTHRPQVPGVRSFTNPITIHVKP